MVNVLHLQRLTLTNYAQLVQLALRCTPGQASGSLPSLHNLSLRTSSPRTMPALCATRGSATPSVTICWQINLYSYCALSLNVLTGYFKVGWKSFLEVIYPSGSAKMRKKEKKTKRKCTRHPCGYWLLLFFQSHFVIHCEYLHDWFFIFNSGPDNHK